MSVSWSAKNYSQFIDLRTRPARDLLSALPPTFQPHIVYDLGCGPGNSTIILKERWPQARVTGVDSSPDMLAEARKLYPTLNFIEANITEFNPLEKIDLLFSNATLQWLTQHEVLFPKLIQLLNPQGALAIQMPNNFHGPSHQVVVQLLQNKVNWQPLLKTLRYGKLAQPFYQLPWYYDLFTQSKLNHIQLWETEYFQEMASHEAVFEWIKGSGLRAILTAMDEKNQAQFRAAYIETIATQYPLQANGKVLLPFNRIFMVGVV